MTCVKVLLIKNRKLFGAGKFLPEYKAYTKKRGHRDLFVFTASHNIVQFVCGEPIIIHHSSHFSRPSVALKDDRSITLNRATVNVF